MAIGETAKLVASLQLDTNKFDSGITKANKSLGLLGHTVSTALGVGLANVASKGLSLLGGVIEDGIQGALSLEKAQAQTAAVIASTGGAAGVTADQIRDLANSTEDLTTVDDKTIQQAENLLLTFTNIGSTVFPQATKAVTDMAVAMNKGDASTADLDSAAIQLGKALNDPIKGITALSKVGVSFSAQQIDQIKKLSGQGNALKDLTTAHVALTKEQKAYIKDLGASVGPLTAARKAGVKLTKQQEEMFKKIEDGSGTIEAQKIILAELEKEFGKAGSAAGTGFAADISRANDAIGDAKISIAQGLMPALGEVARELATAFKDPKVIQGLKDFGTGIGNVIKGGVAFAKTVPWGAIADSLRTAAGFAKDLLNAFLGLPTWVQTAVITGWGLNKLTGGALTSVIGSLASGLIKGVLGINAGVVNINAAAVNGGGLPGVGNVPGAAAAGAAGIGLGTIAVLAIAPASIAALGIAITNAIDPQHIGATTGKAETATARGIPDWNNKALQTLHAIEGHTDDTAGQMEKLRGLIAQQAKTPKQADAILAAGAQRDKETSDAINTIVAQQATSNDIETLRGRIAEGLQSVDTSTMNAGRSTSIAATQAGFHAAQQTAASGWGIEGAIARNRPIINVDVQISATDITQVNVVEDRGGSRSGSRDGDGGGGPGQ